MQSIPHCPLQGLILVGIMKPSTQWQGFSNVCSIFTADRAETSFSSREMRPHRLADLSLQVMKYTFIRQEHAAGPPDEASLMIRRWYTLREVQEGECGYTLTMINYLPSAKMELCQAHWKKMWIFLLCWCDSWLSDRQTQQRTWVFSLTFCIFHIFQTLRGKLINAASDLMCW